MEFNPPEVFEELQKQMMECNDLPSPRFKNVAESSETDAKEEESEEPEYFEFSAADVDVIDVDNEDEDF